MIRQMNLQQFIERGGVTQAQLARALGVPGQLMWQWVRRKRPVPIERCVAIEQATLGCVTRSDLRPDDWQTIWPELAVNHKQNPAQTPASSAQAATESVAQGAAHG